jgi:hypothetical protein
MRLYLSSFRIGSRPDELLALLRGGRRAALILNADDYKTPEDRAASLLRELEELRVSWIDRRTCAPATEPGCAETKDCSRSAGPVSSVSRPHRRTPAARDSPGIVGDPEPDRRGSHQLGSRARDLAQHLVEVQRRGDDARQPGETPEARETPIGSRLLVTQPGDLTVARPSAHAARPSILTRLPSVARDSSD